MPTLDQIFGAIGGFGAGLQGQGPQYMQGIRQQQQQSALAALSPRLQSGEITPQQYLLEIAKYDPEVASKLAASQAGLDKPSAIKNYEYYMALPTKQDKEEYLRVQRGEQWRDVGGSIVNPLTGQAIDKTLPPVDQPANIKEKEKAKAIGGAESDAIIALPEVAASADLQIKNIDELIGNGKDIKPHPGLASAVGPISSKIPTLTDETADFEARLDQIKSGAFLQSIKNMQGYGALSNEEGAKAESAATRMRTATSEEGFVKAAKEYREVIAKGVERIQKKAQGDFSSTGVKGGEVPLTPAVGQVQDGYEFLGGDPSKPESWKKVQ